MPRYRLKQPVDWKYILEEVRWGLELRLSRYERERALGWSLEQEREQLRVSCLCYHALRAFLGYGGITKLEQKALALLEQQDRHSDIN